jgi:N-methylhydantoinase B
MRAGERIYHRQPGGGGYGHPFERDPEDVAADVKNGFVSVQKARTDYGVVIDEESGELDNTATRDARAALGTDEDPGVS